MTATTSRRASTKADPILAAIKRAQAAELPFCTTEAQEETLSTEDRQKRILERDAARSKLVRTVPTTMAGLQALVVFVHEAQERLAGAGPYFDEAEDAAAFAKSLNTAVRTIAGNTDKALRPPALGESELIEACCKLAGLLAGYHAVFKIDPDGDNKHAAKVGDKFYSERSRLLKSLVASPAVTAQTLAAKAAVVGPLLDDECGSLEEDTDDFIRGLANEAAAFLKQIAEIDWLAALDQVREERARDQAERRAALGLPPIPRVVAAE